MSRAARTMVVFGVYLLGLGAVLMIAPNLLLGLFRIPATSEVWIRVVGVLAAIIGLYYLLAVRAGFRPLFAWSVPVRMAVSWSELRREAEVAPPLRPPA